MDVAFQECLKKKRITPFSRGVQLVSKEVTIAGNDLKSSQLSFEQKNFKWATIQAYFSMFHTSRALLYAKNYREKSHHCLIVAMRALYSGERLIPEILITAFQEAKQLRESADYAEEWSEDGASGSVKAAKDLLRIAKKIIKKT